MYKEGDIVHYKQPLVNCTIQRCWDEVMWNVDLEKRRRAIDEFNQFVFFIIFLQYKRPTV